jgi:[ribosomal protein S5]-alanine N-acetyltransferase
VAIEIKPLDLFRFFEHHPRLETERLVLRQTTVADAVDLHAYFGDWETAVFVPHTALKTIQETEEIISRCEKYFAERDSFRFSIVRKSDDKAMGILDLHSIHPEHHRMEIGYGLAKAYWGNGYMIETVQETIRFGFEEMGLHRMEAECQSDNLPSIRVLERCGMALEATRLENEINKGRFVSNHVYAILRD